MTSAVHKGHIHTLGRTRLWYFTYTKPLCYDDRINCDSFGRIPPIEKNAQMQLACSFASERAHALSFIIQKEKSEVVNEKKKKGFLRYQGVTLWML